MPLAHPVPDLSALELLVTVKQEGSISKAAKTHMISQPAASMKIKMLEDILGLKLLERTSAGARLTETGVLISSISEKIIEQIYEIQEVAEALRQSDHKELRVASSTTVAEYLVPGWIHKLHLQTGRLKKPLPFIKLSIKNSRDVIDEIRSKSAEIGFIESDSAPEDLRSKVVFRDELVVVARSSHPLAKRNKAIPISLLADVRICIREEGSGTREVLERTLSSYDVSAANLVELASTTAIKTAVGLGTGIGVLSKLAVKNEVELASLKILTMENLYMERNIHAIWRKDRLSHLGNEFLNISSETNL
jgi:molybdate transport repressor ModE-like protein